MFVVCFNEHGEEMVPMKEKYGNCLCGKLAFVDLIDYLFQLEYGEEELGPKEERT